MKTFKEYFTEKTHPPMDNWQELLASNKMLASGVKLCKAIEKLGGEAVIVGGSVRDLVLGKPIKDVDIATNVPLEKIKQHFRWNDIGGSGQFGITMVHVDGFEYEVANYRNDATTSADNRRPDSVSMVNSFEQDSARRDLTINSMGLDSKGNIIDYQGGLDDLKNGIIRTVGKARDRYMEDALRIIRTARFASKYGFDIDPETKSAMKELGHLIDNLSVERISDELQKISGNGKQLANYIEHLDAVGLLERILPEVTALHKKQQNPAHHPEGDAYQHVMAALKASRSNNPITNIAILFHDLGKATVTTGSKGGHPTYHGHDKESADIVQKIGKRLKLSNAIIEPVKFAADRHMKAHYIYDMSKKKIVELVNSPYWEILKDVVYADEMSRGDIGRFGIEEFEKKMKYAEDIATELSQGQGQEGIKNRLKEKIDGNKVMAWTRLPAGKEMGQILKSTQDWLYGNLDAPESEIKEYVMSLYAQMKSKTPESSLEECYSQMYENSNNQPDYGLLVYKDERSQFSFPLQRIIFKSNGVKFEQIYRTKFKSDDEWEKVGKDMMVNTYDKVMSMVSRNPSTYTFTPMTKDEFEQYYLTEIY